MALSWPPSSLSSSSLQLEGHGAYTPDTHNDDALRTPDHSLNTRHVLDIHPWFTDRHPAAQCTTHPVNHAVTNKLLFREQHDQVIVVRRDSGGMYEEEFTDRMAPPMDIDAEADYDVPHSPRGRMLELLDEREMELSPPSPSRRSLMTLPDPDSPSSIESKRYILDPGHICSSPPSLSPPLPFYRGLAVLPEDRDECSVALKRARTFAGDASSATPTAALPTRSSFSLPPFPSSHGLERNGPTRPCRSPGRLAEMVAGGGSPTSMETDTTTDTDTMMDDCPELSPPSPRYAMLTLALADDMHPNQNHGHGLGLGFGLPDSHSGGDGGAASGSKSSIRPLISRADYASSFTTHAPGTSSCASPPPCIRAYDDPSHPPRHPALTSAHSSFRTFHPHVHPSFINSIISSNASTPSLLFSNTPQDILSGFSHCSSQLHAEHTALLALRDKTVRDERENRRRNTVLREYERVFEGFLRGGEASGRGENRNIDVQRQESLPVGAQSDTLDKERRADDGIVKAEMVPDLDMDLLPHSSANANSGLGSRCDATTFSSSNNLERLRSDPYSPNALEDTDASSDSSPLSSPRLSSCALPELVDEEESCPREPVSSRTAGETNHDWGGNDEHGVQHELQFQGDSKGKERDHYDAPLADDMMARDAASYHALQDLPRVFSPTLCTETHTSPSQIHAAAALHPPVDSPASSSSPQSSRSACPTHPQPPPALTPSPSPPHIPAYRSTATQIMLERIELKHKRRRDKERLKELHVILGVGVEALLELGECVCVCAGSAPTPSMHLTLPHGKSEDESTTMHEEENGINVLPVGLGLGLGLVLDHQHQQESLCHSPSAPFEHAPDFDGNSITSYAGTTLKVTGQSRSNSPSDLAPEESHCATPTVDDEEDSTYQSTQLVPQSPRLPQQTQPPSDPIHYDPPFPRPSLPFLTTTAVRGRSRSPSPSPPSSASSHILLERIAESLLARVRAMSKLVARMAIRRREVAMRSLLEAGSLAEVEVEVSRHGRHSHSHPVGDEHDVDAVRARVDTAGIELTPCRAAGSYHGIRRPLKGSPLKKELFLWPEDEDADMMAFAGEGEEVSHGKGNDEHPQITGVVERLGSEPFPNWSTCLNRPVHCEADRMD